jgi:hypothetical protein
MWVKKDNYFMQNGEYTITKSHSVGSILPYGLHHKSNTIGFFKTADEAKQKHQEVSK